jgi:hypothetical protein
MYQLNLIFPPEKSQNYNCLLVSRPSLFVPVVFQRRAEETKEKISCHYQAKTSVSENMIFTAEY